MEFVKMTYIWFLILCLKLSLILGQEDVPIVIIPDGALRGSVSQTIGDNTTYYAFRGIPFAKKPVENLRFASPVQNDPWTETLDATQDKDWCTQPTSAVLPGRDVGVIGSEDCLYINVYTTAINGSLPVMVWIYGGGFTVGTSSYAIFRPDFLLEQNVIYVAFNYRLGVFGFLSTEDSTAYGNWGLKDQVLALKWVKNNIRYFGGDPDKITIFGESAGGASVSYLVQSTLTTGLYHRAIMHSGTSLCLWALARNARRKAFNVGSELGIFTLSSETLIDNLRQVDYKTLSMAETNVTKEALLSDSILAGLPFGVVKEPVHSGAVFSTRSHPSLKNGEFQKVPLIIGYNSNEGAGLQDYVDLLQSTFILYDLDMSRLAPYDLNQNLQKLLAGKSIRTHYFGLGPVSSQQAALRKFYSVDQFNRPIRETVNVMSGNTNVYFYKFSYKGLLGNPNPTYEGVGHAEELSYLFVKPGPFTPQDIVTRSKFVTLWTNFAKTGNPTPPENGTILQDVTWTPNKPGDNTNENIIYLHINETLTMNINPDQPDWNFYQGIYRTFGSPPYATY